MTDKEIFKKFEKTRDESLIAELFERNRDHIRFFLEKKGFVTDIDDILQEGYIKVHLAMIEGKYSPRSSARVSTWIFGIVLNRAIDIYIEQKKQVRIR